MIINFGFDLLTMPNYFNLIHPHTIPNMAVIVLGASLVMILMSQIPLGNYKPTIPIQNNDFLLFRFAFGGTCVTSTNGFQFVTVDSNLQNIWYLKYEAKHDMNLAGAGDLAGNMASATKNFNTIVEDQFIKTGSRYCFNTNNIQKCL
jgi:hypothetical protein